MAKPKPKPYQDAVARYLRNNTPAPKKPPARPAPRPAPPFVAGPTSTGDPRGEHGDAFGPDGMGSAPVVVPRVEAPDNTSKNPENFVPPDFESYLGMFGLPKDIIKELTAIFRGESDAHRASQRALAYVRGTTWYAQTYPGIKEAIAKGTVRDERDYRSRLNDFNQIYKQYANRDIQLTEYEGHLKEGVDARVVGQRFQGAAIADTYGNDWQYVAGAFGEGRLTGEETTALGRQQAGLDTPLGMRVARGVQEAQRKLQRVFEGQLATGVLSKLGQERPPDVGR